MTPETEARVAEMRAELAELREAVAAERSAASHALPMIEGLASGEDEFELTMVITGYATADMHLPYGRSIYVWRPAFLTTWNEIMERIGPSLMDEASEVEITRALQTLGNILIREQPDRWPSDIESERKREVAGSAVDDVLVQLFALRLIDHGVKKRTSSDRNRYWSLTSAGQDQVMRLRAIRKPTREQLISKRREALDLMKVADLRSAAQSYGLDGRGVKAQLVSTILDREFALTES